MERVLLLLVNVYLLYLFRLGTKLLLLSLLHIFKIGWLRYAINSLVSLLLPLTSHTHVHFLSRVRSLLLRYKVSNHSSLIKISLLFSACLRNGRLMALSYKLLLLLLSRIDLSRSAHRIDRLWECLSIRLSLLFVCLICCHASQILGGHRLCEISITVVIFIIIKSLIIILLIVYVFRNFMGIVINKGVDSRLSYIRWFVSSVIEGNLDLIKVSLIELLLSIQIS
jgi:hypothetical protein